MVRLRPYRIPEAEKEAVRDEIRAMLKMDVIEESNSAWRRLIVIVPKLDGSLRFCNDFRRLNEISVFDAYPMPRVDELLERLGPARFISTLDLTRGYWQVPLTAQAKEKTAFATPDGLFQFKVLPFGVHGAPATFQRLMDQVLRPHSEYAASYLDDIVVHSTDWETHLERLEAVLGALRTAGLTAKASKCHLGLEEAHYLGYKIKKRQLAIIGFLEANRITFEEVDIATQEDQRLWMYRNIPQNRHPKTGNPLPPQIFNGEQYCGDYEDFFQSKESNTVFSFLHLPSQPSVKQSES
ncbi:hypothetical protein GJAV_G00116710 [Gymnothorax javanicus]|nr:hypothetical protein GJAV_G00116710 [Gymnothorax javanicus]